MNVDYQYLFGWINSSVHSFLVEMSRPSRTMNYVLITRLDSDPDLAAMLSTSPQLRAIKSVCQVVGQGILLRTNDLLRAEKSQRIFHGFDEAWFFPKNKVSPKPTSWTISGPDRISGVGLSTCTQWMRDNECSLGLGDGVGLNLCVRVRGLPRDVVHVMNEAAA